MAKKLTADQERLLAAASLDSRAPCSKLGKMTRIRESRVRSMLLRLTDSQIIRQFAMINAHALGYTDFCLFLRFEPGKKIDRERFKKFLLNSNGIAWVAELAGEFSYSVSLLANGIAEVDQFLLACANETRSGIVQKSFAVRELWSQFQFKPAGGRAKAQSLTRKSDVKIEVVDDLDRRILARLAAVPDESSNSSARHLGIPAATYLYRLKSLESRRIVLGYPYVIDPNALGLHSFRILIYERSIDSALRQKLFAYAQQHPFISAFVHCIGEWDYELNVEVPSPPELSQLVSEIEELFGGNIQMIKTLTVLQTSKINQFPF